VAFEGERRKNDVEKPGLSKRGKGQKTKGGRKVVKGRVGGKKAQVRSSQIGHNTLLGWRHFGA